MDREACLLQRTLQIIERAAFGRRYRRAADEIARKRKRVGGHGQSQPLKFNPAANR
jgi:hypothetical protein